MNKYNLPEEMIQKLKDISFSISDIKSCCKFLQYSLMNDSYDESISELYSTGSILQKSIDVTNSELLQIITELEA